MAIFTNQATLSYNGNSINSNIVTGNIIEVLSATKTAVSDSYTPDGDITYIISLTNSGATPLTGVTITDNLGEYTSGATTLVPLDYVDGSVIYYQNGVIQPAPAVTSTQPLIFNGISVPAGGNAIIVYEARTNSFAPLSAGSTINNTATITASGLTAPVTAEETVSITDNAVLSIIKALSPVNVTENSELTYSFTIQNTGNSPATATDNIVITDIFNPALSDITVTLNGTVLSDANYTYNETTGAFSTLPGVITVPAAAYSQDTTTGAWIITPGVTTLTVSGTV